MFLIFTHYNHRKNLLEEQEEEEGSICFQL